MNRCTNITGVILAGGQSTRMGSDKAMLLSGGKPFIQHIAETLETVFTKVIIVADRRDRYSFLGFPVHADIMKQCGPLGGLHSALVNASTDAVFVVACDMPFLHPALIRYVISHAGVGDAAILESGGILHPLCGLYRAHCIPAVVRNLMCDQHSMQTLLSQIPATIITPGDDLRKMVERAFITINTPEDYRECDAVSV